MRTTLDIPRELMEEALRITNSKNKTQLIKRALENIIQKNKIRKIKDYKGKVALDIDLEVLRKRK
ncbi:MAG: type II toxin-antitoxin system VapB family antitoxin [Thermodesulfobacteriota bacterium]